MRSNRLPDHESVVKFVRALLFFGLLSFIGISYAESDADKLYDATDNGDITTVKDLIEGGTDVNSRASSGSYALHAAAVNNHYDLIELLIAHKANPNALNSQGDTPLICATKYAGGDEKTVQLLLDAGTDVSLADKKGNTAVDYAVKKKQEAAIALLESAK